MPRKINYRQQLNPAQLKAVESVEGPYLVIAGAGSGKTRVLVHRLAYLVEKGIRPEEILLLTFTRRAAEEMLRRAALLVNVSCSGVSGGTFHSFANSVLRKYGGLLGLARNFTIMDQADAEDTLSLIRRRLGLDKAEKRFPRKHALLEIISAAQNKSLGLEDVIYEEYPQFMEFSEEIKNIRREYEKYKRRGSLLDYDDLLLYLKELLLRHQEVSKELTRKYKYIMVDEYQDTNKLQAEIACLLAGGHKNIMVVGDDAQSIYSFRGANFRNIMDFPRNFKGSGIITLEENYRSTQPILDLANAVIRQARDKFEKRLYTVRKKGNLPVFVECRDENAQSRYVADKILELKRNGLPLKEIAVLFRSGWHSNDLEVEMSSRGLPFVKYGGQKFMEAAHIKDMLSYLRIACNRLDQVSWLRALLLIPGIGRARAAKIIEALSVKGKSKEPAFKKSADLARLFEILDAVEPQKDHPSKIIEDFLGYYQPLMKLKYDDFHKRANDLDSLLRIAGRYGWLEQFLADVALEPPERSSVEFRARHRQEEAITLSTIHSAKGLEWDTVFLIYAAEGHLPSYLSLEDPEDIEEERRLFYVASTRAKSNLFFLKPQVDGSGRSFMNQGGGLFCRLSRFLEEGGIIDKFVDVQVGEA